MSPQPTFQRGELPVDRAGGGVNTPDRLVVGRCLQVAGEAGALPQAEPIMACQWIPSKRTAIQIGGNATATPSIAACVVGPHGVTGGAASWRRLRSSPAGGAAPGSHAAPTEAR